MSIVGNSVALNQLLKALDVLEMPHDKLPEVKDKDGVVITDAKEKRLMLVRQFVANAGNILDVVVQGQQIAESVVAEQLESHHREAVRETIQQLTGGRVRLATGENTFGGNELPPNYPDGTPRRMGFHPLPKN